MKKEEHGLKISLKVLSGPIFEYEQLIVNFFLLLHCFTLTGENKSILSVLVVLEYLNQRAYNLNTDHSLDLKVLLSVASL